LLSEINDKRKWQSVFCGHIEEEIMNEDRVAASVKHVIGALKETVGKGSVTQIFLAPANGRTDITINFVLSSE
jgi:hypothetical protein